MATEQLLLRARAFGFDGPVVGFAVWSGVGQEGVGKFVRQGAGSGRGEAFGKAIIMRRWAAGFVELGPAHAFAADITPIAWPAIRAASALSGSAARLVRFVCGDLSGECGVGGKACRAVP